MIKKTGNYHARHSLSILNVKDKFERMQLLWHELLPFPALPPRLVTPLTTATHSLATNLLLTLPPHAPQTPTFAFMLIVVEEGPDWLRNGAFPSLYHPHDVTGRGRLLHQNHHAGRGVGPLKEFYFPFMSCFLSHFRYLLRGLQVIKGNLQLHSRTRVLDNLTRPSLEAGFQRPQLLFLRRVWIGTRRASSWAADCDMTSGQFTCVLEGGVWRMGEKSACGWGVDGKEGR